MLQLAEHLFWEHPEYNQDMEACKKAADNDLYIMKTERDYLPQGARGEEEGDGDVDSVAFPILKNVAPAFLADMFGGKSTCDVRFGIRCFENVYDKKIKTKTTVTMCILSENVFENVWCILSEDNKTI